jgi:MFS family permease
MRQSRLGRAFQLVWTATGVSNLGDGATLVALPLMAATLTQDPALIAGIATAQRLPWLLFTLFSGVLVDRVDRLMVQQATNFFRAAVIGLLGVALYFDWASIFLLFVAAFLLGVAETLYDNAAFALLPTLVEHDQLERANGRIFTTQTVANELVGPTVGGTLFAWAAALPFLVSAMLYSSAATLVRLLHGSVHTGPTAARSRTSFRQEIAEGIQWFWGHRLLHILGIKAGIEHGCWAATYAVLVLVVTDRLGLGATAYGLLLSASAVGGVIGALIAPRISMRLGTGRADSLNMVLQSVAYFGIALSANAILVALMLALLSFTGALGTVVAVSFRQAIIPKHLAGRVSSAFRLYAVGAMSVGALAGGLLARNYGLLTPYWVSGVILLVQALVLLPIINNRTMGQARQTALMQLEREAEPMSIPDSQSI